MNVIPPSKSIRRPVRQSVVAEVTLEVSYENHSTEQQSSLREVFT